MDKQAYQNKSVHKNQVTRAWTKCSASQLLASQWLNKCKSGSHKHHTCVMLCMLVSGIFWHDWNNIMYFSTCVFHISCILYTCRSPRDVVASMVTGWQGSVQAAADAAATAALADAPQRLPPPKYRPGYWLQMRALSTRLLRNTYRCVEAGHAECDTL